MEEMRNIHKILVKKPEREEKNSRIKCGLYDDIKVDLNEIGSQNVNWIDMAEERVYWQGFVNTVMNQNYLSFLTPVSARFQKK